MVNVLGGKSLSHDNVVQALEHATTQAQSILLPLAVLHGKPRHEFLVMLKPEIVVSAARFRAVQSVFEVLEAHAVSVRASLVTSDPNILNRVVRRLYPRLNLVAKMGLRGASPEAQERVRLHRGQSGATPIAASAAMAAFSIGAVELRERGDDIGCLKFGSGVYGAQLEFGGSPYLVLNPFWPAFQRRFSEKGSLAGFLWCYASQAWSEIRACVIGHHDPKAAHGGSVRAVLFANQRDLGVGPIDIARNGIHISPGPLEAAHQLQVVFGHAVEPKSAANRPHAFLSRLDLFEKTEDANVEELVLRGVA